MSSIDTRNLKRDSLYLMAELAIEGPQTGAAIGGATGEDPVPAEPVKVRNLSSVGMMVEGGPRVTRGTRVAIEIHNIGLVMGVVAWVRGTRFGVALDKEIDPRLARTQVYGGNTEAPVYARAARSARHGEGWYGKMRPV